MNPSLACFPYRFQIIGRMFQSEKEVRRILIGKYAAFYVVEENLVIVFNILYSGSETIKDKFKLPEN